MNPPISSQRVLYDITRRIGLVPEGSNTNLDPDKAYEILAFMDDRLQEGWEIYDFVETTAVEQRAFRADFDPEICYPEGEIVWDPGTQQYYQSLAQTIGGPLSNTSVWQANPSTVSPRWIPYWQDGHTPIGVCYGAWSKNPYEDANRLRIDFDVTSRGLEFTRHTSLASVWLVFRIPYPGIGRAEWESSAIYNQGDSVIDGMDSYICLSDNTLGKQPSTSSDYWTRFRIPYCMARFVTQAAFADTLVVEGQNEKAPAELGKAYAYLQAAYDQQELQQGQLERWRGYAK